MAVAGGTPILRGAWHVHTTASDGRAPLAEVARAARAAGLGFLVVTDHDARVLDRPAYVEGVLVIPGSEASSRLGHVVALGTPRPLAAAERDGDPLAAVRALGGAAVLAHPLHPRRAWRGPPGKGGWRGLEVVSNDTTFGRLRARWAVGTLLAALPLLPWDPGRALLEVGDDPRPELARLDAEVRAARESGERARSARVLLCSADAHGWPSYRATFEAFSMHVQVPVRGDPEADAAAVTAALLDGRAACVFDVAGPAAVPVLSRAGEGAIDLEGVRVSPDLGPGITYHLVRDGAPVGPADPDSPRGTARFRCPARCPPGDYRAEVWVGGSPWIFTNPVRIE